MSNVLMLARRRWLLTLCLLACASEAAAQSTGEVWGNLTVDWLASERLVYTLDVEPKVQVTAVTKQARFANVEVWPTVEFALAAWLDAHGEFLTGFTSEQDGSDSTEFTERMGLLHSDSPTTSSWRFRCRVELAYPLNRAKLTQNGTVYLTSDTELFAPLGDDSQQDHINQWRLRNGVGYRASFRTRIEALYIWTTKKDSDTSRFATDSQAIDFRIKLAF